MQQTIDIIESYGKGDFPKFAALYDEDDQLHIEVLATAIVGRGDYGVPGSPVWDEIEDVEVEEYVINGDAYTSKELKAAFPDLYKDLATYCAEISFSTDWS